MRTTIQVTLSGRKFVAEKISDLIRSTDYLGKEFTYKGKKFKLENSIGPWHTYRLVKGSGSKGINIPKGAKGVVALAIKMTSDPALRDFLDSHNLPDNAILMSPMDEAVYVGGKNYEMWQPPIFHAGLAVYVPVKR